MSNETVKYTHLTVDMLRERLQGVSASTLSKWRTFGSGPKFIKSGRRVLYPLVEVERWEQANLRSHTSEHLDAYK